MITFLAFITGGILGVMVVAICSAAKCADCDIYATSPQREIEGIQHDIDKAREKETIMADILCGKCCPVRCTRTEVRG